MRRWTSLALPSLLFCTAVHAQDAPQVSSASGPAKDILVRSYIDKESAGWALKNKDEAFVAEQDGCRVQWNAVELKPLSGEAEPRRSLSVKRCTLPFESQLTLHRAILKAIDSTWKLSSFEWVSWGSFRNGAEFSWNVPLAVASAKSKDFRDYRLHYPNSKLKGLNAFFVEEANRLNVYAPLKNLFREFGIEIRLDSVEKVFTGKSRELPLARQLRDLGIADGERVMWDVGDSYFRIWAN